MPLSRIVLWVASIGAIALAVRSIVDSPVPPLVAWLAFAVYVGIAITGVLVPQLEMFGEVISRGPPDARSVALTFDDGPSPVTTPRVLEALAVAGARATFFVLGAKAEAHPDVLREIVAAGHELGVHGYQHHHLYALLTPDTVARDIQRARDVVERETGIVAKWFRPPVGQVSPRTAAGARRAGVPIVAWSVRGLDGLRARTPEQVVSRVTPGLVPGAIVLLHDAAEDEDFEPAGIAALPRLLASTKEKGLATVTLDELLHEEEAE
ncbi:MAG TPA: polysaccharide deacetylase family protein [Polyangiaceae bacterium]|nr:polysaccharide deacetylase family protein [Polyangiaceae bacterium]